MKINPKILREKANHKQIIEELDVIMMRWHLQRDDSDATIERINELLHKNGYIVGYYLKTQKKQIELCNCTNSTGVIELGEGNIVCKICRKKLHT